MQFGELLCYQHTAGGLFLLNLPWADDTCSTRSSVSDVHSSHLWTRDNPRVIREYRWPVRVSVWAGIVGDVVMGAHLLPDGLTTQRYLDFLETALPGLHEDVPLAVRQMLWFQHVGAPAHSGEDVRQ
jgi:hypothetical protein